MIRFIVLFLLCNALLYLVFELYAYWSTRHERRLRTWMGQAAASSSQINYTQLLERIKNPMEFKKEWKMVIAAAVCSIMGSVIALYVFEEPLVFGLVFGGVAPYVVVSALANARAKSYRQDVREVLEYGTAVLSVNGDVSQWITDVVDRLEGPLKYEFEVAAENLRSQIPPSNLFSKLAQDSPDQFFRYVCAGVLSNMRSAGDLHNFLASRLDELLDRESYERRSKQERDKNNTLMAFIAVFPIFLYFLFNSTVEKVLADHWQMNFAMLFALVGYILLFLWAKRITTPEI